MPIKKCENTMHLSRPYVALIDELHLPIFKSPTLQPSMYVYERDKIEVNYSC